MFKSLVWKNFKDPIEHGSGVVGVAYASTVFFDFEIILHKGKYYWFTEPQGRSRAAKTQQGAQNAANRYWLESLENCLRLPATAKEQFRRLTSYPPPPETDPKWPTGWVLRWVPAPEQGQ